jgi:hypothetical protein
MSLSTGVTLSEDEGLHEGEQKSVSFDEDDVSYFYMLIASLKFYYPQ